MLNVTVVLIVLHRTWKTCSPSWRRRPRLQSRPRPGKMRGAMATAMSPCAWSWWTHPHTKQSSKQGRNAQPRSDLPACRAPPRRALSCLPLLPTTAELYALPSLPHSGFRVNVLGLLWAYTGLDFGCGSTFWRSESIHDVRPCPCVQLSASAVGCGCLLYGAVAC